MPSKRSHGPLNAIDSDTIQATDYTDIAERAGDGVDEDTVRRVLEAVAAFECDRHPWRDAALLWKRYYREGLTQEEIADRLGCGQRTITRWMERHGISPGRGRDKLDVDVPPTPPVGVDAPERGEP